MVGQHARDRTAGTGTPRSRWPMVLVAVLAVVAAVIGAGVYLMVTAQPIPGFVETERQYLFPEARERRDAVRLVGIETAGGGMTFRREGQQWALAERDGYPADARAVDDLVRRVVDLRAIYVSEGGNPDHAEYGVTRSLESSAMTPVRVTLRDEAGEALARVVVGDTSRAVDGSQSDNTFVRRDGDSRVWVAEGELRILTAPDEWLQREIVNIDRSRVFKIVMQRGKGEGLSVARNENGAFAIESGPISESDLEGPWALEALAAALEAVVFEAVEPAAGGTEGGAGTETGRVRVLTVEGIEYLVRLSERETGVWGAFSAELRDQGAAAGDDGRAERVAAFNRRHEGWVYRLPRYAAEILTRRPEDIGASG